MSKNIVILLDGTSNEISSNRTNILRLYGVLEKSETQLVYYDPGVGTFGAEGSWFRLKRKAYEIWGLATGWGIDYNVKEAYRFLMHNYDGGRSAGGNGDERDRIYIFGFSRGAYTARVLAGFINAVGLIEPRNENLLDYAYRAYKRIGEQEKDESFSEIRLYERMLQPDRPPIRLLGLFDTVASVIENGRFGARLKSHAFTSKNRSVESVYHAVAIDERRTMFNPRLWEPDQQYWGNPFNSSNARPQDVSEVWFAGGHGDVGGGYPEEESQLAKVPLAWMIEKSQACGLKYRTQSVNSVVLGKKEGTHYVAPDAGARSHNTMTVGWWPVEFIPRRKPALSKRPSLFGWTIPLFERRTIPCGAKVHQSVIEKSGLPPNLPTNFDVEV